MSYKKPSEYTISDFKKESQTWSIEDPSVSKFIESICSGIDGCYNTATINPDIVYSSIDKLNMLVNKLNDKSPKTDFLPTCLIHMAKLFKINGIFHLNNIMNSDIEKIMVHYNKSKYCFKNYIGLLNLAFNENVSYKYACEEYLLLCDVVLDVGLLFLHYSSIQEDVAYSYKKFPKIDYKKDISVASSFKVLPLLSYNSVVPFLFKATQLHSQDKIGESLGYVNYCIEKLFKNKDCKATVKEYRQRTDIFKKENTKTQKVKKLTSKFKIKQPTKLMKSKNIEKVDIEDQFMNNFINEICIPLLFLIKLNLEDLNDNVSFQAVRDVEEIQEEVDLFLMNSDVNYIEMMAKKAMENTNLVYAYKWRVLNGVLFSV